MIPEDIKNLPDAMRRRANANNPPKLLCDKNYLLAGADRIDELEKMVETLSKEMLVKTGQLIQVGTLANELEADRKAGRELAREIRTLEFMDVRTEPDSEMDAMQHLRGRILTHLEGNNDD